MSLLAFVTVYRDGCIILELVLFAGMFYYTILLHSCTIFALFSFIDIFVFPVQHYELLFCTLHCDTVIEC